MTAYIVTVARDFPEPEGDWTEPEGKVLWRGDDFDAAMMVKHLFDSGCDPVEAAVICRDSDGLIMRELGLWEAP